MENALEEETGLPDQFSPSQSLAIRDKNGQYRGDLALDVKENFWKEKNIICPNVVSSESLSSPSLGQGLATK